MTIIVSSTFRRNGKTYYNAARTPSEMADAVRQRKARESNRKSRAKGKKK